MLGVRKLSNFILYSSLWVSACAGALVIYTYDITDSHIPPGIYTAFVMCATLALYAAHRILGMERVKKFKDMGRFAVIAEHKTHIVIYGVLGAAGAAYFLLRLDHVIQLWLLLPALISFLYVVPVGWRYRLRDVPLIKIFLVAVVWATFTGLIPYIHTGIATPAAAVAVLAERATFIFAITIPFDIRDIHVDSSVGLRTLPHALGVSRAKKLAIGVYVISALLCAILITNGIYRHDLIWPYALSWLITAGLILGAQPGMDDHYFSGLLDGTMFILPFLYWLIAG